MSTWIEAKFSDFCDITRGGSPRPIQDFMTAIGTPWVKIADATASNSRYIKSTKEFIKVEGEAKSRVVYPGDFILSNSATPGLPRFMKIRACIHDGWLLLRNIKGVDELFLYYLLLNEREALLVQGNGSIFTNLKTEILKNHVIKLPSLPEQKTIAAALSSLDDKIDLLQRQNATLEAMAETLFRQKFVVEVKEDWEEVLITDLFEVRDGTHDSPKQTEIGKPLITLKHILNGYLDIGNAYLIPEDDFNQINQRSKVDTGDILFSMIGTIGLLYWEQSLSIDYAIKNIGLFKTSQNPDWSIYTYLWLKSPAGRQFIDEHKSGSTQEYVALGSLRRILFQKPPMEILREFNKLALGYFSKIKLNRRQIQSLEKLRDTLLPKFMSGEVRVKL